MRSEGRAISATMDAVRFMRQPSHFPHLQPDFLQAHLAWSVQQVQALPLSHAQAASLAQLHLSPQEQGLPATHSHLALQAQPCFSPLQVQHPANTAASATAAIIINFFISFSFRCVLCHAETIPAGNAAYYLIS
jgi:hypothetical protein